jgi:hypothetical protein
MMQRIEDAKLGLTRSIQDLQHIRNTTICFCKTLPPSEMKSLYGSISRSAVSSLSYVIFAMLPSPTRSPKSILTSVEREHPQALRPLLPKR